MLDRDRPRLLLEIRPRMLEARYNGAAAAVVELFQARGYRMFALNGVRLEERRTVVADQPWKDDVFIHPTRAGRLADGVFEARMAA